jgi:RNA-splicing ligase RtcB
MFGVLQAFDRQVAANLSGDLLTGNLCAPDVQIVTGIDVQVVARADFGIRPGGTVAVVFACGSVDVGENADARFLKSVWINGLA